MCSVLISNIIFTTCQPIQALEHPKFKEMINIAARSTEGVHIPGRKATRTEIINLFKQQLSRLKEKLNVSLFSKLFIKLWHFRRAQLSKAKFASRVTDGRPVTLMVTLLSQDTGSRRSHRRFGNLGKQFLGLLGWTTPIMGNGWVKLCSRLFAVSVLYTRSVCN